MATPLSPLDFAGGARRLYREREVVIDGDCRYYGTPSPTTKSPLILQRLHLMKGKHHVGHP